MNRKEWELSCHHLRELFRVFSRGGHAQTAPMLGYKFALQYNPMFDFFHLWNGISSNTVATFKVGERLVVRYRPHSYYEKEIQKVAIHGKKSVFIPSDRLSRHRNWVANQIQSRVNREIERVKRDFLDQAEQRSILELTYSFPIISPRTLASRLGQFGQSPTQPLSPTTETNTSMIRVRVLFNSLEQQYQMRSQVQNWLQDLVAWGTIHRNTHLLPEEIQTLHERYDPRQVIEMYRNQTGMGIGMARDNTEVETYYGRPMEQVRRMLNQMEIPDGTAVNDEIMFEAVQRLDRQNVERQVRAHRRITTPENVTNMWEDVISNVTEATDDD